MLLRTMLWIIASFIIVNCGKSHSQIPTEEESTLSSAGGYLHPLRGKGFTTRGMYPGHPGHDTGAPSGTPIIMVSQGKILKKRSEGACGQTVHTVHTYNHARKRYALRFRYCHLVSYSSHSSGITLPANREVGYVGSTGRSTGPHLHTEAYHFDVLKNPVAFLPL